MTKNACSNVEFATIHPSYASRDYRYTWCLTSPGKEKVGILQGVAKVDVNLGLVVQKWIPKKDEFLSELVFVPRSEEEEDGYLIGYLMHA